MGGPECVSGCDRVTGGMAGPVREEPKCQICGG